MRNLLKYGPPPLPDLGDAVSSVGELLVLAEEEDVHLDFAHDLILDPQKSTREAWATQGFTACQSLVLIRGVS